MNIRDWKTEDMPHIAELHRKMALGYQLPETFGPLFFVRKVFVDDDGKVIGAAAVKLIGEAYIWLDTERSEYERAKCVKILQDSCGKEAARIGLEDVSAWIPTKLLRCFRVTLEKLGWKKSPWRNFSIVLK